MTKPEISEPPTDAEEPPSSGSDIELELTIDSGVSNPLSESEIRQAIVAALTHRGFSAGTIGVRITDDETIRQLNARHLGHDYATDVISFGYTDAPPNVEGELVVSADTARREAAAANWQFQSELLLYIVHGVLHITGMDDHKDSDRAAMRAAEEVVFLQLGIDAIRRCGADQPAGVDQPTGIDQPTSPEDGS